MNFNKIKKVVIFCTGGGIGKALLDEAARLFPSATLYACSRTKPEFNLCQWMDVDITNDEAIKRASQQFEKGSIDQIIIASGLLHDEKTKPEKRYSELTRDQLEHVFNINIFSPSMIARYFLPLMATEKKAVFAVLSARVGSISDNRLGGWYSYRASKSALNMIVKTLSIETKRFNKELIVVGLHPGTVKTSLSSPYLSSAKNVFTTAESASHLWSVVSSLEAEDSGFCFDWQGKRIDP